MRSTADKKPLELIVFIGFLLVTYAVAVYSRFVVLDKDMQGTTFDVTTADGYGWLTAVSGLGSFREHLLASIGRLVMSVGHLEASTLALYAPIFASSIAAPLVTYWGYKKGSLAGGVFAGVLGLQLPAIYARTGFGYFDSDAVIVPLLVLTLLGFEAWLGFSNPRVLSVAPKGGTRDVVTIASAVVMGIALHLTTQIHILFLYNAIVLVLVSVWLYPRLKMHAFAVLCITLFGVVGLGMCLVFYWFYTGTKRWQLPVAQYMNRHRSKGIALMILVMAATVLSAEMFGMISLIDRFGYYVVEPVKSFFDDDPAALRVQELNRLDAISALQLFTGNVYLSLLGWLGVAVAIRLDRSVLFLLFPLMLGLAAPLLGARFAMFGSLVIVMSSAVVLSRLVSYLSDNRYVQIGILGFLALFYCQQLLQIYQKSTRPVVVGATEFKQALAGFNGRSAGGSCDLILSSWHEGYLANYYARLPAVMNGAWYPLHAVIAQSRMMLAADIQGVRKNTCALLEYQKSFVEREYSHFGCGNFNEEEVNLDVTVSWDNIQNVYWWAHYANKKDELEESYVIFEHPEDLDLQSGVAEIRGSPTRLSSVVVVTDDEIRTTEYDQGTGWHLIMNEPLRSAIAVDARLYDAFFMKAFLGRIQDGSFREKHRDSGSAIVAARLSELCS